MWPGPVSDTIAPMTELDVRASGEHTYEVTVSTDDGGTEDYVLTVPEQYVERVAPESTDEARVVRCALELMLEQDGARMPARFSLADVERAYPGFDELLAAGLRP